MLLLWRHAKKDLMLKMQLQFDIAEARKGAKAIKVQRFKRPCHVNLSSVT